MNTSTFECGSVLTNHAERRRVKRWGAAGVALVLGIATLLAHGGALGDALFLDDHWHQVQLRDLGWSWSDLLHTTTLEPERFMESWWQERPIRWQYARPFSILLTKLVYHATGGSVPGQHAFSILLHYLNACLVYLLCVQLTGRRFWSLVGGLLFVIYSHSIFAVGWLAAQNTVLQTGLTLGALLLYVRASGLRLNAAEGEDCLAATTAVDPPPLRRALFGGSLLLWCLALFSRENAVVLPVILAACDLAFGGRRRLYARRAAYGIMAVVAVAFLLWRFVFLYHPLPDVYFRRPDGDASYLLWCLAKLMHYVCSAVWLSPMTVGPTGRGNPFTEVPGDCLLMTTILAVMGVGYYLACRRAKGFWIWPLWLVLSFLPVVPILATPHSGYLAGVGFSVAMVLGPGLRDRIRPVSIGRWSRPVAIWFLVATSTYIPIYRTLWRGMIAAERYAIAKITSGPAPQGVTDIFFLNVPFVNIYASLCLEEAWGPGVHDVRCHSLTYAPNLVRMEDRCVLQQIDGRRFTISVEGRPYFSGLLGRYLIDSVRSSGSFHEGQVFSGKGYDVEIMEMDAEGVRKLMFTFQVPLADERLRFYLTTRDCPAALVRFDPPGTPSRSVSSPSRRPPRPSAGVLMANTPSPNRPLAKRSLPPDDVATAGGRLLAGESSAAEVLFACVLAGEEKQRQRCWEAFCEAALPVAGATASPMQAVLTADVPADEDFDRVRTWWRSKVNDERLNELLLHRRDFERLREERDGIFRVRSITAKIIQTDLYLSGPPFPGPKWEK